MTMPPSKEPTEYTPDEIWASELRFYRQRAGLSQEELGTQIGWSRSTIQHAETERRPTMDVVRACDAALEADGVLIRLREKLSSRMVVYPSFLEWQDREREATALRGYESVLVPGLLQTAAYASLTLKGDGEQVASRLQRQAILAREDPPTIRYLLDEWVLRRPVGGAEAMVPQLEHLEELVTSRRISIQISPSASVPGTHGSFVLATIDGETIGYEESTTEGFLVNSREGVLALEAAYDDLLAEALPSAASLQTIRRIKEEWQQ